MLDKLRERWSYRFTRYTRLTQERRAKEISALARLVKDASAVKQQVVDKEVSKVQKQLKALDATLTDCYETGKALFADAKQEFHRKAGQRNAGAAIDHKTSLSISHANDASPSHGLKELATLVLQKRVEEVVPAANAVSAAKAANESSGATDKAANSSSSFPVSCAEQLDVLVHYFASAHAAVGTENR